MKNLEFFRNVSIGQYVAGDSILHRMKPSTKFLWLLGLVVPASVSPSVCAIALAGIVALALALASGIRPGFLARGIVPVLPLVALTAVLQGVFSWPGDESAILLGDGKLSLTAFEAGAIGLLSLRFWVIIVVIGLFTSTITESQTAHGIEDLLSPLSRFGFPSHELALAVAVAFRFIPIVAGELESIVKAQASRGADFGGRRGGPIKAARSWLPLIVPVTVRALERAEALAEAMEARAYVSRGRTRFVRYEGLRGEGWTRAGIVAFTALLFMAGFFLP